MVIMVKTIDSQWLKNERLDVQRWEDEGGHLIENNATLPDPSASINVVRHHASLQWNERFVMEPFQPNNGVFFFGKKLQGRSTMARTIHRKGTSNG
jgi:hypothetical protein